MFHKEYFSCIRISVWSFFTLVLFKQILAHVQKQSCENNTFLSYGVQIFLFFFASEEQHFFSPNDEGVRHKNGMFSHNGVAAFFLFHFLFLLAFMATSGGHFSRPLGMGGFWS